MSTRRAAACAGRAGGPTEKAAAAPAGGGGGLSARGVCSRDELTELPADAGFAPAAGSCTRSVQPGELAAAEVGGVAPRGGRRRRRRRRRRRPNDRVDRLLRGERLRGAGAGSGRPSRRVAHRAIQPRRRGVPVGRAQVGRRARGLERLDEVANAVVVARAGAARAARGARVADVDGGAVGAALSAGSTRPAAASCGGAGSFAGTGASSAGATPDAGFFSSAGGDTPWPRTARLRYSGWSDFGVESPLDVMVWPCALLQASEALSLVGILRYRLGAAPPAPGAPRPASL